MPAMDSESNVVSIAAWTARHAPDGDCPLSLISHDGGRIIPFNSAGTRAATADDAHAATADEAHAPKGPDPETAA